MQAPCFILWSENKWRKENGHCPKKSGKLWRVKQKVLKNTYIQKPTSHFKIVWPFIVIDSLWIKTTDALNSNFMVITTLYVSGSLSAHHQEFLAVHRLSYIFMLVCPFATWNRMELLLHPTPGSKRSPKLHKMYQSWCTVKNSWWWAERLPETCREVIPIK